VTLGGVERRREIFGEVRRDRQTVVEACSQSFGALGQREQSVLGQVDAWGGEVRDEHIEEDEDAAYQ